MHVLKRGFRREQPISERLAGNAQNVSMLLAKDTFVVLRLSDRAI